MSEKILHLVFVDEDGTKRRVDLPQVDPELVPAPFVEDPVQTWCRARVRPVVAVNPDSWFWGGRRR